MIGYMQDIDNLLNQLPVYTKLNTLYAGGNHQSYTSPAVDYYKLQHTRRYRFKRFDPQGNCDCPACQVYLDVVKMNVATERVKEEKSKVKGCSANTKWEMDFVYFCFFV